MSFQTSPKNTFHSFIQKAHYNSFPDNTCLCAPDSNSKRILPFCSSKKNDQIPFTWVALAPIYIHMYVSLSRENEMPGVRYS